MANRPNPTAPIALLLAGGATAHASLALLVNLELEQVGAGFAALAAGLLIGALALFFAPKTPALLVHWLALTLAALGCIWAAASSYVPRTIDPFFAVSSVFAAALVWNAFYALQWWLGGNPSPFLIRMGFGYFVAAAANLAYIPFEVLDEVYIFIVDDVLSAIAFGLVGFFLMLHGREEAPAAKPETS